MFTGAASTIVIATAAVTTIVGTPFGTTIDTHAQDGGINDRTERRKNGRSGVEGLLDVMMLVIFPDADQADANARLNDGLVMITGRIDASARLPGDLRMAYRPDVGRRHHPLVRSKNTREHRRIGIV